MAYRIGDEIGLPEEPPVGTVLHAEDGVGGFEIERTTEGWTMRELPGYRPVPWRAALNAWGPNGPHERPFRVVSLPAPPPPWPRKCESCGWSYDRCTLRLRNEGQPCCASCHVSVNHFQTAWERVHGPRLISEIFPNAAARRVDSEADGA